MTDLGTDRVSCSPHQKDGLVTPPPFNILKHHTDRAINSPKGTRGLHPDPGAALLHHVQRRQELRPSLPAQDVRGVRQGHHPGQAGKSTHPTYSTHSLIYSPIHPSIPTIPTSLIRPATLPPPQQTRTHSQTHPPTNTQQPTRPPSASTAQKPPQQTASRP